MNSTQSIDMTKGLKGFLASALLAAAAVLALSPLAGAFEGAYAPEAGDYNFYQDEEGRMALVISGKEAPGESMSLLELDIIFPDGSKADVNLNPVEGEGVYTDTDSSTYLYFVEERGASVEFKRTCNVGTWTINFGGAGSNINGATIHMAIQGTGDDAYTIGSDGPQYLWGNMSPGSYPDYEGHSVVYNYITGSELPTIPAGHLLEPDCDDEKAPGTPNTSTSIKSDTAVLAIAGAGAAVLAASAVAYRRYSRQ